MKRGMGTIRIIGRETDDHTVPADVLISTLKSLQQLVLLAAAAKEGRPLRKRFKASEDLRHRHQLVCGIPKQGSYEIAVEERDESGQQEFSDDTNALSDVFKFATAIADNDSERMREIIPDQTYCTKMLNTVYSMAPSDGDQWELDLSVVNCGTRRFDHSFRRDVDRLLRSRNPVEQEGTVIGELVKIDFAENKLFIRHPETDVLIDCSYDQDVEDDIVECRREYIQVIGQVLRNSDLIVTSVTDVSSIVPVDLSPFDLDEVETRGCRLKINPSLRVTPELDEDTKQVFLFDDDSLDLHIAAATRADLVDEIAESLVFSWEEYALVTDAVLSKAAIDFKHVLKQRLATES